MYLSGLEFHYVGTVMDVLDYALLKDKVENEELTGSAAAVRPAAAHKGPDVTGEAIEALMALGYQSGEAAAAVAAINPMPDKVDEVIRLALKGMVK